VTESVFANAATATSAQTAIYTQMHTNRESYSMALNTGLLSDELINYSAQVAYQEFYTNSMNVNDIGSGSGPWGNAFKYIYSANQILEGLKNNNKLLPKVVKQLSGESKFIRAFWHFYLANAYGDVPIVTTIDYTINNRISRSPKADVYQQVISDLKDAQGLLSDNFVDGTDTAITTERIRPTKWAATALLAKVYLYAGQYQDAKDQATQVINKNLFSLSSDLNAVFLANSSEAIWQLAIPLSGGSNNGRNTEDGYSFILQGAPDPYYQPQSISHTLINAFEPGDNRRQSWTSYYQNGPDTFYFPYKYKVQTAPSGSNTEYTMVLRVAEQYLIRAEAEAKLNNFLGAASDLNKIRNRAGLPDTNANDQATLLAAILHERQVELFTEWGNRWFDLARTGAASSVMGPPGNVTAQKGGTWNPNNYQLLFPIPQNERSLNPNLTQNLGY
jgi:hypothetical protein